MTLAKRGPMPCQRKPRRGFVATVTAINLLGLTSVALTSVVAATLADVRRTRRLETDAQLRQLLLAGAADAAARAASWGDAPKPQSWDLALPASLTERGCRVQMSMETPAAAAANSVDVGVEAHFAATVDQQILRFVRTGGVWKPWGLTAK